MTRHRALIHYYYYSLSLSLCAPIAHAQNRYAQIPPVPGGTYTEAYAVSLDGRWVVGHGNSTVVLGGTTAWRWSAATGTEWLGPYQNNWRGSATAVSGDGSVIAGDLPHFSAGFRWELSTGKVLLPGISTPAATSADGKTIVGAHGTVAVIWTTASQTQPIPGLLSGSPTAISADGTIVSGWGQFPGVSRPRAFRWVVGSPAAESIGTPIGMLDSVGRGMSADGRIIVGDADHTSSESAFLWTQEFGFVILPKVPGYSRLPRLMSASLDGKIISGWCTMSGGSAVATIWTGPGPQGPYQAHRMADILSARGVGVPAGSHLALGWGMTPDGRTFVGLQTGPTVPSRGFRAEICYANCDMSSTAPYLNIDDFTCFINAFAEAQSFAPDIQRWHYANCDKSSTPPVLNIDDFICFVNQFAAGCDAR